MQVIKLLVTESTLSWVELELLGHQWVWPSMGQNPAQVWTPSMFTQEAMEEHLGQTGFMLVSKILTGNIQA